MNTRLEFFLLSFSVLFCGYLFSPKKDIGVYWIKKNNLEMLPSRGGRYREEILGIKKNGSGIWIIQQNGAKFDLFEMSLDGMVCNTSKVELPNRTVYGETAFDFNGQEFVYYNPASKSIDVLDMKSNTIQEFEVGIAENSIPVRRIRWTTASEFVVLLNRDRHRNREVALIKVVNSRNGEVRSLKEMQMFAFDMNISPSRDRVACWGPPTDPPNYEFGYLCILEVNGLAEVSSLYMLDGIIDCSWAPDGERLVFVAAKKDNDSIFLYDLKNKLIYPLFQAGLNDSIYRVGYVGQNQIVCMISSSEKRKYRLVTVEVPSGNVVNTTPLPREPGSLLFCPLNGAVFFSLSS